MVWLSALALTACTPDVLSPITEPAPVARAAGEDPGGDGGGGTEEQPDSATEDLPSAYEYEGDVVVGDPVDLGVVESALDRALAGARGYNSEPAYDAYSAAMVSARPDCPIADREPAAEFWIDHCVTSDGSVFQGFVSRTMWVGDGSGGQALGGNVFNADATITTAAGYTFVMLGDLYDLSGRIAANDVHVAYTEWSSGIAGTTQWDGPGFAGTWVGDGLTPAIALDFIGYENGAREGTANGVVGMDLPPFDAVSFGDVAVWNDLTGAECAAEPGGTVSLRDSDGDWYDVAFDGGLTVSDVSACDGCGEVWWRGQDLGQVCVDVSPLLDWVQAPW
jgi:hypothetical protein